MGNYAVYHLEKGNTSSGGIGNHIDRKEGAEHTYRHADPNKKDLNQSFNLNSYCSMPLHKAIEERIKAGYNGKKAIRKDAVKYTTHILTGSHDKMKEIEKNPELLKNWVIENKKFLEEEFGKENIVRFTIHRDEKTPHLHAVTVNLTSDGRLSAKEIIGNKKDMQNRQDRYAQAMQSFGLERGLKSTGIKHENAREYYARMEEAIKIDKESEIKADKNFLGVYKDESIKKIESALKSQKIAFKMKDIEISKLQKRLEEVSKSKIEIIENIRKKDVVFDKTLVDEDFREDFKGYRIRQLGDKYGYEIAHQFHFVPHSIQQKSDLEIEEMIISRTLEFTKKKGISAPEFDLLLKSKELHDVYYSLIKERDRRNELDQIREQERGRKR